MDKKNTPPKTKEELEAERHRQYMIKELKKEQETIKKTLDNDEEIDLLT